MYASRLPMPVKRRNLGRIPIDEFRKRSVALRSVEYGQGPKDVLSGAFLRFRRTASTQKFKRMSRRFADGSAVCRKVSGASGWRSIGDVALGVLLARVPHGTARDRLGL